MFDITALSRIPATGSKSAWVRRNTILDFSKLATRLPVETPNLASPIVKTLPNDAQRRKILRLYIANGLSLKALFCRTHIKSASLSLTQWLTAGYSRAILRVSSKHLGMVALHKKTEDAVSMTGHRILFIGLTDNNRYRSVIDQISWAACR